MDILEYKVIGLDADRPPMVQTRPCIDLIFQLNEAAPRAWCDAFQACVGKQQFTFKIDPEIGLHIETWVRTPDQIAKSLETTKLLVVRANEAYVKRLKAESQIVDTSDETVVVTQEQRALNDVVRQLVFDD